MEEVHVFRPDHDLYCIDCGEGELMGNHGVIAINEGQQIYASVEVERMYAEYTPSPEDDLEADE